MYPFSGEFQLIVNGGNSSNRESENICSIAFVNKGNNYKLLTLEILEESVGMKQNKSIFGLGSTGIQAFVLTKSLWS